MMLMARIRLGRAIGNLYDGVMAGETWAIGIVGVLCLVIVAAAGVFAFQVWQESQFDDEDDLSADEKNLMNKF